MKKLLPLLVFFLVGGSALFFAFGGKGGAASGTQTTAARASRTDTTGGDGATENTSESARMINDINKVDQSSSMTDEEVEEIEPVEVKPATEVYKSMGEALKAIKDGATDYNDLVLEQFTQVGQNCSWCDDLYKNLKDLISTPGATTDQKSYFAEVLAVSGRPENVAYLIDSIKSAKNQEEADLFAEALELTVGKNEVVKQLGDQLDTQNETMREASVAALTNQGSKLAAEMLYKHTTERGDADGYYAVGIGLGEFVPDEEAYPALQEMMNKHDQYSHLAVKAMLNSGMNGLRMVLDSLSTSKDVEFDRKLLKDAVDHVNYETGIEDYLKEVLKSHPNEAAKDFAKKVLEDYSTSDAADPAAP